MTCEWSLTLTGFDSDDDRETIKISLTGEDLGTLVGEAIHAGLMHIGHNAPSPVSVINDIISQLTDVTVLYQNGAMAVIQQALLRFEDDEDIDSTRPKQAMIVAMRRAINGEP
jgi:hypothetical protein